MIKIIFFSLRGVQLEGGFSNEGLYLLLFYPHYKCLERASKSYLYLFLS